MTSDLLTSKSIKIFDFIDPPVSNIKKHVQ